MRDYNKKLTRALEGVHPRMTGPICVLFNSLKTDKTENEKWAEARRQAERILNWLDSAPDSPLQTGRPVNRSLATEFRIFSELGVIKYTRSGYRLA
jgi:hypothetical protein